MGDRISDLPTKTPALTDQMEIETAANASGKYTLSQMAAAIGAGGGPGVGVDADAVHVNVNAEISGIAGKTTPADADVTIIEDSAASDAKKSLTWANIKATLKTYLDGLYVALASSTNNAITRFNGTGGQVQDSLATIDDSGTVNIPSGQTYNIDNSPHAHAESEITFTDITTNDASTTAHGFSPKATAPAAGLLSVLGIGNGETVRTDKAIFDTTNPEAIGVAAPGTQVVAARRDHVHAISIPHMMQSDTTDQAIANTANAQVITFDTDEHHLGITRTSSSRFTCPIAGSYSVTFTGTAVGVNTKVIHVWPRVSGTDVTNSNTAYTFKSSGGVAVITAHFILHLTANQYIEMWTWGDDTGNKWDATAVGSSPDRPAIPSVRLTIEYLAAD